jgi:Zn-dependent M28 family amino/carboxypeptidase
MKGRRQLITIFVAVGLMLGIVVPPALALKGDDIRALFLGDNAFAQIEALVGFGPRVAGTPAELAAADYIAAEMESYGLDVEIQEFGIIYFEELSDPELEQVSPNPTVYQVDTDFATMDYSGSGDVTAVVEPVDIMIPPGGDPNTSTSGCEAADFAGFTPGNIALIQRGECYYSTKALNAQAAGAVGVIIFNEGQPGRDVLMYGTLGGPGVNIPVVSTSFYLGEELYDLTLLGDVEVYMFVDTITEERTSQNVIGTLEGTHPEQGIVYIGGHYDSVSGAVGANDDASGVAATLEAARVLATKGHRTKATLKFIAFGAEEIGLDGSYWYVDENYDEVTTMGLGMVNLDMIGVGDTLQIGNMDVAPQELTDYATEKAETWDLDPEYFTAMCNSDHCYFEDVGVPVAFLTQRPDPYYHTPEDTPDKIILDIFEVNGELATSTMYDWAKNPAHREAKGEAMTAEALAAHFAANVRVYHDRVYAAE